MVSIENGTSGFKKEIEEISNKLLEEYKTLVTELFKIERDKIRQKIKSDKKNRSKENSVENNTKLFESISSRHEKEIRPVSTTGCDDNSRSSNNSSNKSVPVRKSLQDRPSDRRNIPKSSKPSSEESDDSESKNPSGGAVRKFLNGTSRRFQLSSTDIEKIVKTPIRRRSAVHKPIPPFPNNKDQNPKSDVLPSKIPISSSNQLKRVCTLTSMEGYCSDCKLVVLAEKAESTNKDNKDVNKDKTRDQSTKVQDVVVKNDSIQKDDKVERFIEHLGRKLHKLEPLQRILAQRMIAEICSYARRKKLSVNTISSFATLFSSQSNKSRIEKSEKTNFGGAIAKKTPNTVKNSESIDEREVFVKEEKRSEGKETRKPFELDHITLAEIDTIVRREKALLEQYINF